MGVRIADGDWAEAAGFLASLGVSPEVLGRQGFQEDAIRYLLLLLEKNKAVNLTGARDLETAFWKHLVDSLCVLAFEPMGVVADWGSGGGLPGIPLALFRKHAGDSAPVYFMDSVGKKIRAIEEFCDELSLTNTKGFIGRGEELLAKDCPSDVSAVVMRAVAPPERAVRWLSARSKNWIFFLGPSQVDGWRKQAGALGRKGLFLAEEKAFALPRNLGERRFLRISTRST